MLQNDLDRHQMGLLDLQEAKSSLCSAMESEAVRSANISKEVEVLNKVRYRLHDILLIRR